MKLDPHRMMDTMGFWSYDRPGTAKLIERESTIMVLRGETEKEMASRYFSLR